MDILPLHIEYLLTRHDCVIVPGIGAFIASEKEAHIDIEKRTVIPRRREITFNSSVVTDDGLLSHSIARKEHLQYETAHRRIAALIESMKADLRSEGEISLGMLGKLLQDEEGLIRFQPRISGVAKDIMPDISLTQISSAGAAQEEPETMEGFDSATETVDSEGVRTIQVPADRYVFTIKKRLVHAAAMLITIFTVGLSLLIPINHDNEQKASVVSIDEFFRRAAASMDSGESKTKQDANQLITDSIGTSEIAEMQK